MSRSILAIAIVAQLVTNCAATIGQQRENLDKIQNELKEDVPRLLCVDERFAIAGQPKDSAYAKLAQNGYRAVLGLRTNSENVDLGHEKEMVEKAGLRFINIPVVTSAPKSEQVDDFINAVKDRSNQPMLIHCGGANRVGAFWMIYRVVDQGWPEDKALDEAMKMLDQSCAEDIRARVHHQSPAQRRGQRVTVCRQLLCHVP